MLRHELVGEGTAGSPQVSETENAGILLTPPPAGESEEDVPAPREAAQRGQLALKNHEEESARRPVVSQTIHEIGDPVEVP